MTKRSYRIPNVCFLASILIIALLSVLSTSVVCAHEHHYDHPHLHRWTFTDRTSLRASIMTVQGDIVSLESADGRVSRKHLSQISTADRPLVDAYTARITAINDARRDADIRMNTALQAMQERETAQTISVQMMRAVMTGVIVLALMIGGAFVFRRQRRMVVVLGSTVLLVLASGFTGMVMKKTLATNPQTIDSAFAAFRTTVTTSWNSTYFLVGSLGIPEHEMMTGITAWQQQVPIPQCYLGTNAWSIPLNPVVSANPIPVNPAHFSRGAIAIAVNGVSIFNPYTNTGVDAFLDGQLDKWGGHSGRADDYHYHTAPMHLYGRQPSTLPIAYAFDGYPVFGTTEPDGSAMRTLDAQHGHDDNVVGYHYHGSAAAPYMIAAFHGVVTEDSTHQVIPQPSAKSPRPATTPLKGAVITAFAPTGANGYVLTYTLNNQVYKVEYSWTSAGSYTYRFVNPDGTSTSNTYKGNAPCSMPATSVDDDQGSVAQSRRVLVSPNPAHGSFRLIAAQGTSLENVTSVTMMNAQGRRVLHSNSATETFSTRGIPPGMYTVILGTDRGPIIENIIIE